MPTLRRMLIPALVIAAAIVAAGCGPSGATAAPAASAPAASAPAASAPAGAPDSAKIQQCLAAAGITLPSGGFGPLPSGFVPPSGGFRSGATDPAVAAALEACGITPPAVPSNP